MILYDQPLGYNPAKGPESVLASFDTYYNNYYDAYFVADDTADNGISWVGYGNKGADKTKLGGYGKWYLDPDGTIPFTEENMQNMPAGNIDVYYHHSKKECKIYFVDAITGKDLPPVDGIEHVINNQTLTPGTTAEHFAGDKPVDPTGASYFAGWFYDKDGTKPYSFEDEIPGDTIVYAIWRPKLPTTYTVRHILVGEYGYKKVITEETGESYVGDTIDKKAKDTAFYDDSQYADVYFKPDNYSKSMVLVQEADKNILEFYYEIPGKQYTVEYKDIESKVEILPEEVIKTKLSQATVGMKGIDGWTYQGYTVDDSELADGVVDSEERQVTVTVTKDGVVVTFWCKRDPIEDTIRALKLLDGVVLTEGTWFHFELVDAEGNVVKTAQSVNGFVDFSLAELGLNKEGTYWYTLREVNDGGRFQYDDNTLYEIKIDVPEQDKPQELEYTITYYRNGEEVEGRELNFKNVRLPAQVTLTADKYLNGELSDGFRFVLEGGGEAIPRCGHHVHNDDCYREVRRVICGLEDDPDHVHTDDCYAKEKALVCGLDEDPDHPEHTWDCYEVDKALIDQKAASKGKVTFKTLEFSKPGTYLYKVYELETEVSILRGGKEVKGMEFRNIKNDPSTEPTTEPTTEPSTSVEPSKPDDTTPTTTPDNPTDEPATGDTSRGWILWLVLMIASAAGIVATLVVSEKKQGKRHSKR